MPATGASNNTVQFRNWLGQPANWVTIGFLAAIFFAPWGSVPRYAGWSISLIALLVLCLKGGYRGPTLNRFIAWLLAGLLLAGALTTAIMKPDLYLWVKGFSQLAEFSFSIWLAAWVFVNHKEGIHNWLRAWYAGTAIFLLWGAVQFFQGTEVLFPNINSLGLYICLVLPLLLGAALQQNEKPLWLQTGQLALVGLGLFMLVISFTTTAWATGALQLVLFFILMPSGRRRLAGLLAGLAVAAVIFTGVMANTPAVFDGHKISREIDQLRKLMILKPGKSSEARIDLIRLAAKLGSERPLLGWGWGRFDRESARFADHPDFKKASKVVFMGDAHSMYFNLWVRGGAVALLGVGLVHVLGGWRLGRVSRLRPAERELAIPAMILIISIFLYSLGGDVFQFRYKAAVLFWTVLGFACMYRQELDDEAA